LASIAALCSALVFFIRSGILVGVSAIYVLQEQMNLLRSARVLGKSRNATDTHIELKGWRLWATLGLFSFAFLFTTFCLAKIFSVHGSRWDISWAAVAWLAAGIALVVSLLTLSDSGTKH
jgi:hypothetical protein